MLGINTVAARHALEAPITDIVSSSTTFMRSELAESRRELEN